MKKRILSVLLALAMIFTMFSTGAFSAPITTVASVQFNVSNVTGKTGDTIVR